MQYLFLYCDKSIDTKTYAKDIVNPFLSHSKEDQIDQSKFHFGKRAATSRKFIFRIEKDGYLWHWMTTSWKPLTIDSVKGLLPQTAWSTTEVEPTDYHGGQITYNMMFPDDTTAIVTIDAGKLDGMSAMNIKSKIFSDLGEIQVQTKLNYRHTNADKIGQGLIETIESMNRIHDMLPNLINVQFNTDMLGEYKDKLGKDLTGKLTNNITVYHALAILRDAGKKTVAGTVLINAAKVATPVAVPVVQIDPIQAPDPEPVMTITPLVEE